MLLRLHVACCSQSEAEIPSVVQLLSGVPVIKLLSLEQLQELARAFQVGLPRH